jgi:hypothetical protein
MTVYRQMEEEEEEGRRRKRVLCVLGRYSTE